MLYEEVLGSAVLCCAVMSRAALCLRWPLCRLRDEHNLRHNAEAELQSVKSQLASHKEQLHDAVTGQANAAQLSQELHREQSMHSEVKAQLAVLQSR